jgi:hypothetical protein
MVIVLGSVWGFSEAALGMGLRSCAAFVSGAVMTGVALFFIAAGWAVSRRVAGIAIMVVIAALFKMFDALLLSFPLTHGAIGNPMFAFFMEAIAFVIIFTLMKAALTQKAGGQALLGGMSAVLAVNLFPLVRFATGVPACVAPGTTYPLSLYYIHFAVLASSIMVPLGFWVGAKVKAWEGRMLLRFSPATLNTVLPPAALAACLAIIALIRLT